METVTKKNISKYIRLSKLRIVELLLITTVFVSTYVLTNEFPFLLGAVLLILVIYVIYKMISTESVDEGELFGCLLYTSPSPRDKRQSRMPSSA